MLTEVVEGTRLIGAMIGAGALLGAADGVVLTIVAEGAVNLLTYHNTEFTNGYASFLHVYAGYWYTGTVSAKR